MFSNTFKKQLKSSWDRALFMVSRTVIRSAALIVIFSPLSLQAGWTVDFSRRQSQGGKVEMGTGDATVAGAKAEEKSLMDRVFQNVVPTQDVVIINTEQGFMPSTVRVKEGGQYRVIVVNVNEKARNVSFVLDSFSEHHATFYGKIKSFHISPKKEGVYTFISPETSAQGRIVVYPSNGPTGTSGVEVRSPASE